MTLEEIRIGNIISAMGRKEVKVEGISTRDGLIETDGFAERGVEDFEGAPITEEWLLSKGAHKNRNQIYFGKGSVLFSWFGGGKITIDIGGQMLNIGCPYKHQLQNLYYAVTQKEL